VAAWCIPRNLLHSNLKTWQRDLLVVVAKMSESLQWF